MTKWFRLGASLVACGAAAQACLPGETRPPPGGLTVTATADQPVVTGLTTADGWKVRFDRFVMSLGYVSLDRDDACDTYAGANYGRLLDFVRSSPQRVGAVYAVGDCQLGFRVPEPPSSAVLGEGVTAGDLDFMRAESSDKYATDAGITLRVAGAAEKGGTTKTFDWAFRRALVYEDCGVGGGSPSISLASEASETLDLLIRGQALFQTDLDDQSAELRFEPFARADDEHGDGDGNVTLDELAALPLGELGKASGPWATDTTKWKSFRDYLYLGLVPTVPRFRATGRCSVRTGSPKQGMGGPMH
ncbi:MAG: hypothetical protein HYZ29_30415 [Myxococcales bacterium]|nr:hypothetical protein [Myxococcales bacterium]